MLERARENLAGFQDRVELVEADFSRAGWTAPLKGRRFQAMVSYQAIHNLFEGAAIRRVYAGAAEMLEPGGVFWTCDNIATTPLLQDRVDAAYQARRGPRPAGRGAGSGERFAGTLEEHLRWLQRAGFRAADCPWRELQRAMLMALR